MTTAARIADWLTTVAGRTARERRACIEIPPGASLAEVWSAAAKACGLSEPELAPLVAAHFNLPVADLERSESRALRLVPEKVARRYAVLPVREDDRHLVVATSDPTDLDMEEAVRFSSGRQPRFEIASPGIIREAIDSWYAPGRVLETLLERLDAEVADGVRVLAETKPEAVATREVEAAPVVKMTNLILRDAVAEGASDIHLEPGRESGLVRVRVDGVLRHYMRMPLQAMDRVVSRIKVMGNVDIADRIRPHDGRARVQIEDRTYDLRISTVPTRDTEKAVIRILDPESMRRLHDLQMLPRELESLRRLLSYRDGIVVVTGPTGSGKTTTVYSAIRELASGEVNIMSVEDPVEYELPGVTQIQVEPRRGVTFASALRASLRQDPDVIFVGEIRDLETAEVAVQASCTGHLVLATLHANDAAGVVGRLHDIGLAHAAIGATLRGAVAQRLVRRVCRSCVQKVEDGVLSPEESKLAAVYGARPVVRATGCKSCSQTGYRGRLPLNEVLLTSPRLAGLISRGATALELERAGMSAGLRPLREVALQRVRSGETTLQEIDRVLGQVAAEKPTPSSTGYHVLVVDDDPVNRKVARGLLEKQGFRVSEANDGVSALERIDRQDSYDLVVLDLMMPRLDGSGVLARLRSSARTIGLPVVVLTGSEDTDAEIRLMEAGADDYIRKPIQPPQFMARIKAALRRVAA
ncbi:MAG: ATPase, T2SS/T4P/T4SS family [Acidobacteriota bacterium]